MIVMIMTIISLVRRPIFTNQIDLFVINFTRFFNLTTHFILLPFPLYQVSGIMMFGRTHSILFEAD
jgi:hypothetical protein